MIPNSKSRILVIIGPTASGKSELAVSLAKKYNAEIISADSRQIYKGMDLGTGKVPGKWKTLTSVSSNFSFSRPRKREIGYFYKGVRHYCIDYVNPKNRYSVARFKRDAEKAIKKIQKRGKLVIICGGTGHFIDAVVFNQTIPEIKPNLSLRKDLSKKTTEELFLQLSKLDPERAKTIDPKNPRRLIRALEIVLTTGKPVPLVSKVSPLYPTFWFGIKTEQEDLYKKIDKRLKERLKQGMVKEVEKLHKQGLSFKKLESFGLEYKYIALYLQNKISYEQMFTELSYAIKHYSKRQLTWWKRNKEINWIENKLLANKVVAKFLK